MGHVNERDPGGRPLVLRTSFRALPTTLRELVKMRQVKLRPRNFWHWFSGHYEGLSHGHWSEYVMHFFANACNITFVIGSAFFFTAVPPAWGPKAGSTCFLVASLVMMILTVIGMAEHTMHIRHTNTWQQLKDSSKMSDRSASEMYLEIREFVEELCYFMGSLAYAIGSVLFEPIFSTHFNNPDTKQDIEQWAVTMFIVGSAFFVAAAYQNALAIAYEGLFTHEAHKGSGGWLNRQIVKMSLFSTQFGAVLFFSGSFMYQGKLGACFTGMAPRIPVDQGTLQYVAGSALFLVQSLLALARTIYLHGQEHSPEAAAATAPETKTTQTA